MKPYDFGQVRVEDLASLGIKNHPLIIIVIYESLSLIVFGRGVPNLLGRLVQDTKYPWRPGAGIPGSHVKYAKNAMVSPTKCTNPCVIELVDIRGSN